MTYAIKNQRKARNAPSRGHFVPKPLVGGFGCLELVLYGIRELAYQHYEPLILLQSEINIFSILAFAAAIAADGLHGAHGRRGAARRAGGRRGGRSGFRRGGRQDDALTAGKIL